MRPGALHPIQWGTSRRRRSGRGRARAATVVPRVEAVPRSPRTQRTGRPSRQSLIVPAGSIALVVLAVEVLGGEGEPRSRRA